MSLTVKFSEQGNNAYIFVNTTGDCPSCDNYIDLDDSMTVNELLKLAAEIIDNSPYYKDIFDERLF